MSKNRVILSKAEGSPSEQVNHVILNNVEGSHKHLPSLNALFLTILLLSTLLRLFLSVFPKTAVTYNDELFYLELSQNLFLRGSLTVYATPISFTKLLYPLLLSPFYAVSDGLLRTNLISAFNAVLISSSLVPGYLLARRILKKNSHIILSLLLLALSPNFLFSLTFMAENLYYPLLLWGFYAAYRFLSSASPKPLHAFLLGLLAFLLYFTKEVGAAFAAAAAVAVAMLAAGQRGKKNSRKGFLTLPGCYILGLMVPFLLVRFVLLPGMGYSYAEQVSLSNLSGASEIMYLLYATLLMLLYFLVSACFFPVVLPLVQYRRLSPENRSLLLLSGVYLLFAAMGVAFGVSLHSDYPSASPRIHLRYFIGAAFPFLLLFLSCYHQAGSLSWKSPLVKLAALFAVLALLFVTVPLSMAIVDHPVLSFARHLSRTSVPWQWAFRLVPALFLLPVLLLWNQKRKQVIACFLLPVLFAGSLLSGYFFLRDVREAEAISDTAFQAEAALLDKALDGKSSILLIADKHSDKELLVLNTLLDDDYITTDTMDLMDACFGEESAFDGTRLDLDKADIPSPLSAYSGKESYDIPRVEYIVTLGNLSLPDQTMNEDITPPGISRFRLYRSKDPTALYLSDPRSYIPGNPILFYGDSHSFRNYQPEGFSAAENGFTWSNDTESTLTLKPLLEEPRDLIATWTWKWTLGDEQFCQILANETPVMDAYIGSNDSPLSFIIPKESYADTGFLTLRFFFPEARQPGNGDPRSLAVAFESLTLEIQ